VFTVTVMIHVPAMPWFAPCPWELGIKTSSDTATQTAAKYNPSLRMILLLIPHFTGPKWNCRLPYNS
jgi:hypothetical protein